MRIRRPGTGRFLTEAKATWDAGRASAPEDSCQ
jgi:hypothetical protein